jgi:hypothetical protein
VNYLDLIINSLNQELVPSRGNATIGVNLIAAKNNTIVTLLLDDKECGSKRLAPYSELHGDDTSSLHQVAPMALSVRLVFTILSSSLLNFLKMKYEIKLTGITTSFVDSTPWASRGQPPWG